MSLLVLVWIAGCPVKRERRKKERGRERNREREREIEGRRERERKESGERRGREGERIKWKYDTVTTVLPPLTEKLVQCA